MVGLALLALPALATAGQVPPGSPEDVGLSSERLGRIAEAMERHIEAGNITGGVTVVARKGRIAHFEAHGLMDLDSETPMRKDAAFRIMSMTKPIMAAAVLMMLEEGKIRLADPVSKFLPEFAEMQVVAGDAG